MGSFIISLDFELHWGVHDVVAVADARDHFLRAREAIPAVLRLFERYQVHATWATVGFLFARDKDELVRHIPELRPTYEDASLSSYQLIPTIGRDEKEDPFHYAPSLLDAIAETPGQQIATHTFSHYYCLEAGQTEEMFAADLEAAAAIGARFPGVTDALVFPRGQFNPVYVAALRESGVRVYRAPRSSFATRPRRFSQETLLLRSVRLIDSYVPLSGACSDLPAENGHEPGLLPAGLFLRPYSRLRRHLEGLRVHRIKQCMRFAAEAGHDFHLWWHPHNFGSHTKENLDVLQELLEEHRALRDRHGWESRNMSEAFAAGRREAR